MKELEKIDGSDLGTIIKWVEMDLHNTTERVRKIKKRLELLKNAEPVETLDLAGNMEKYIDFKVELGKDYQYILGGDGRSRPWDEIRNGKVVTVTIKPDFFITFKQQKIIEAFIEAHHEPDHFIIINPVHKHA